MKRHAKKRIAELGKNEWTKKENERKRRYYRRINELTEEQKLIRRKKNRTAQAKRNDPLTKNYKVSGITSTEGFMNNDKCTNTGEIGINNITCMGDYSNHDNEVNQNYSLKSKTNSTTTNENTCTCSHKKPFEDSHKTIEINMPLERLATGLEIKLKYNNESSSITACIQGHNLESGTMSKDRQTCQTEQDKSNFVELEKGCAIDKENLSSKSSQEKTPNESKSKPKRVKRETNKLRYKLKKAEKIAMDLDYKYKALQKRFLRNKKNNRTKKNEIVNKCTTRSRRKGLIHEKKNSNRKQEVNEVKNVSPRKRTMDELREEGISPSKVPKLSKKILLANIIKEQPNKSDLTALPNSKVDYFKRYRMCSFASKFFGADRRNLFKKKKSRKSSKSFLAKKEIVFNFLNREDNAREMPGKNDKKKVGKDIKQKKVLTDSMRNLFFKFKSENPHVKIGLSSFCRMRPKNFSTAKYLSKNRCLCQKHQNMALLLKAARAAGLKVSKNPEEFNREEQDVNFELITDTKVKVSQWKRVEIKGKMKMKIIEEEISKEDFIIFFMEHRKQFREHVTRMLIQYDAVRYTKENLPNNDILVQMDFAENYSCCNADEIQSAYFNPTQVTLHPLVVYFKDDITHNLLHKSFIVVSEDIGHNSGNVFTYLTKVMPMLKEIKPNLHTVHYWTDSPTSQYRNKSIFSVVAKHKSIFGCFATWNYFECGHGKGPCDGLGGTSKRMADQAAKQGAKIQDAYDYFNWADKASKAIKYVLCTPSEVEKGKEWLDNISASEPLKGVRKTLLDKELR